MLFILCELSPKCSKTCKTFILSKSQWVNCENPSSPPSSPRAAYMDPLYIPKIHPINLYFLDAMEHDLLQISPYAYTRAIGTELTVGAVCFERALGEKVGAVAAIAFERALGKRRNVFPFFVGQKRRNYRIFHFRSSGHDEKGSRAFSTKKKAELLYKIDECGNKKKGKKKENVRRCKKWAGEKMRGIGQKRRNYRIFHFRSSGHDERGVRAFSTKKRRNFYKIDECGNKKKGKKKEKCKRGCKKLGGRENEVLINLSSSIRAGAEKKSDTLCWDFLLNFSCGAFAFFSLFFKGWGYFLFRYFSSNFHKGTRWCKR
ncbi:hypothetical protein CEXT_253891 [Caerostris extrusa]|uniref:Uncharacterized protein n=1 Tax=Caerostris extrusa TaxID=172846 RepID=A0AAV4XEN0_CAEEX|nr:hypothetical protein CEXT_253891 [Caerostris extrusa]